MGVFCSVLLEDENIEGVFMASRANTRNDYFVFLKKSLLFFLLIEINVECVHFIEVILLMTYSSHKRCL